MTQGNVSSANANAQNDNQSFQGNGAVQSAGGPSGNPGYGQGNGPQGPGPQGPGPQGPGPQGQGPSSTQSSTQGNSIGQQASAAAQSTQILPTNVNVAPSLFSVGSNDGGVTQGNVSSANANAQNDNQSFQGNGAVQSAGGPSGNPGYGQGNGPQGPGPQGPGPQGQGPSSTQSSTQGNSIGQQASAAAQSTQILPTNVNVAPSLFSVGSNDGGVTQGNVSNANANAQNENQSSQTNLVGQAAGGLLG